MKTAPRIGARVATMLAGAALALALGAAPAAAGAPEQIRIASPMTFNPDGMNYGTFEATGSAVESGTFCAAGTVQDTGIIVAGWRSGRGIQIPVRKTFACADGRGSIFVKIQVHLDLTTATESFSWVAMGGTGAYEGVRGSGLGWTVSDGSDPQTGNINTYEGFVVAP